MNFDPQKIKKDFPILSRDINGHPLVYLDNAATSQKPRQVISAITDFYTKHNANVHRGIHTLGDEATEAYQAARHTISSFIGASDSIELIFVRNTTEAINLVAFSWAQKHLKEDDEIIITELEHHSNLIPWQRVAAVTGAKLIHLPLEENGDLATDMLESLVNKKTKLVALTHVSNVLGTVLDVYHLVKTIRSYGANPKFLVDGAQSAPHMPINVKELDIDFFAFSAHKMLGPMGIGGLWVKQAVLEQMDPFLLGGGMINEVKKTTASWAPLPDKFDAGTPNVAGAVGFAAACDYLSSIGMAAIHEHEQELTRYGLGRLLELEDGGVVELYGEKDPEKRAAVLTFNIKGIHAHDTAQILDREHGVAVRSGHHCNQVLLETFRVPATTRASMYLYNTKEDIDTLIEAIYHAKEVFEL